MEEQNIEFFTIYLLQLSIEKFLNNVKVIYEFIKEKISPKMYHINSDHKLRCMYILLIYTSCYVYLELKIWSELMIG